MANQAATQEFRAPGTVEALFNRVMGFLVGLGIGPGYMQLLQVRGRKTGRLYSTPVDLLEYGGKIYLVAARGRTQWVRNAEAAGEITLKKGRTQRKYRLLALPDSGKPQILKAYLDRYASQVQRFFSVRAGSPPEAFREIAPKHPAFELIAT